MIGAGHLSVQLQQHDSAPPVLKITLARSNVANQLCAGKTVSQALPFISQTYTLCRYAQRAAADMALTGNEPGPAQRQAIQLEIIEQTLWRWLLDIPKLLFNEDNLKKYAALRKQVTRWQKALTATTNPLTTLIEPLPSSADYKALSQEISELLGLAELNSNMPNAGDVENWINTDTGLAARIIQFAAQAGEAKKSELTPHLDSEQLQTNAVDFCNGKRRLIGFTGVRFEMKYQPLLTKLAAIFNEIQLNLFSRLLLLMDTLQDLVTGQAHLCVGHCLHAPYALSWLMTARGLLIHRVEFEAHCANTVKHYQVIAPTDLNFSVYDQSCTFFLQKTDLMQGKLTARILELSVLTLDPCVDYDVEVTHA